MEGGATFKAEAKTAELLKAEERRLAQSGRPLNVSFSGRPPNSSKRKTVESAVKRNFAQYSSGRPLEVNRVIAEERM